MELDLTEGTTAEEPASKPAQRARIIRGTAIAAAGGVFAFLLMAHDGHFPGGVPVGALLVAVCSCGILEALGTFADPLSRRAVAVTARELAWPAARAVGCGAVAFFSLWAAVQGLLPQAVAGGLLTASFIGLVASLFYLGVTLGPLRFDEEGKERSLLRRHGFWLLVAMALLYWPALGMGSLTDPWETHYGEVAREIIARDDWISTWWSWEGWFYSKPILGIWVQSISMATLGVHTQPDKMLAGINGALAHPEWAVRTPFTLFAMLGAYTLYKGVSRWFGRRAALLGGLALATSPQWFLVAHQSMTDMPFVASMSAAVGLVLVAVKVDDSKLCANYEVSFGRRAIRLSAFHLVMGSLLLVVIPQILYLVSRNVDLVWDASGHGFRPHADMLHSGSGLGNCYQPGDPACASAPPVSHFEPWMQALVWTGLLIGILATCWRERRVKRLLYVGAWFMCGLSTMAKGPAGLVIPAACVLVWICATRRWAEIPRMAIGAGLMICVLVVGPWFVAMLVRHGSSFTDELIFHDMYNRAFDHVHDTNSGADTSFAYYVQQLGYALFPWIAIVPVGLFGWLRREKKDGDDAAVLLLTWFILTFALFSMMGTKFHHYILPAVPPAAMLAGVALDSFFRKRGVVTKTKKVEEDPYRGVVGVSSAVAAPTAHQNEEDRHARAMLGATSLAGALLLVLVAKDLIAPTADGHAEGPAHFMWLFTYRYDRPWPASLDMRGTIIAITAVGCVIAIALAVPRLQRIAAGAWIALALVWGAWGLDVYLPKASPHWGQRAVMDAYYTQRAGPEEPIVAFQMNWKGENFYTGNRIPQFGTPTPPPGTPKLSDWVKEQKGKGTSVMYFVTEQNRVAGLRGEVSPKNLREVTTRADCNQFVLVRAEL